MESPDTAWRINGQQIAFNKGNPVCFIANAGSMIYQVAAPNSASPTHKHMLDIYLDAALDNNDYPEKFEQACRDEEIYSINPNPGAFVADDDSLVEGRFWRIDEGYISFWNVPSKVVKEIGVIEQLIIKLGYDTRKVLWDGDRSDPDERGIGGFGSPHFKLGYNWISYEMFLDRAKGKDAPSIARVQHIVPGMKKALGQLPEPEATKALPAKMNFLKRIGLGD